MGKLKNLFTSGRMNKDFDERLVPQGEYRDALNVKVSNSNGSDVGAVENALSNEALSSASFGANATCIGSIADDKNRKIYWFVKSDTGSYVMEYSKDSGDVDFVLTDTRPDGSNVLNFSKAHLITGVNIFIDSDNDKKFIYWTDGLNPPRRIEVSKGKSYGVNAFNDSDVSVIKATPRKEPSILGIEGSNPDESNIRENFFSFAYRYKYADNEFSALSPFSDWAFKPGEIDSESSDNPGMLNQYTSVSVSINTGDKNVEKVELYAKGADSQNLYLIYTLDKTAGNVVDNTEISYNFKNDRLFTVLSEVQFNRIYDNVPLHAKSQEIIGNRIVYANYEDNYDLVDSNKDKINFNLNLSKNSTALTEACVTSNSYTITRVGATTGLFFYTNCEGESVQVNLEQDEKITICGYSLGNITDNTSEYTKVDNGSCGKYIAEPTLRSNRTYDVGVVYFDAYGRKSPVITGVSNSVTFNHYANDSANKITAEINHNPPFWADRYKFAIKETPLDYYTIRTKGPVYKEKEDNVNYYYIKFPQTELNKASNGDTLIVKNNGSGPTETLKKYEVISVTTEEADFIGVGTQDAGVYLKIKGDTTFLETTITEPNNFIFESLPKKVSDSVYYEVPGTYDIINGFHLGSSQDQTASQPAKITLNAYNAYCFGDGSESNRINDSISGNKLDIAVRVNDEVDGYRANKRIASLTYSNVYDSTTSYNGLNEFNLSLANYKDMDAQYGSIQRLHSRNSDLIAFQENKIHKILFNKSVLFNADGTGNVSQTINILSQEVPYKGEYGISFSPESFQSWGYNMYFTDERRGAVCRLTENGIFEISNYGMHDWFIDNLTPSNESSTVGGYDPINDHYIISIKNGFVEWKEDTYTCEGGLTQWLEDTYTCQQESDPTTTTTTAAPTTSTTTVATTTTDAPTTTSTTIATTSTTTLVTTTTDAPTTTTTTIDGGITTTTSTTAATTSTTIPTTPPPTTTTTIQPVFYALRRCSDLSSGWRTQQEVTEISLNVNDRVEGSGPTIYIVTGTTTSGTNIGIVSDTGLTGCPEPVTTTTTIGYNYYYAQPCGGGTTVTMRSVTAFSNGESFKFAGDSTCYEVVASGAPANNNDWSEAFPDCSACLPPPTTTTAAPTTTSDPYNYYTVRGCPGSFYENQDMRIRTLSTLNAGGNPNSSSSIVYNGSSFYGYSTIDYTTWLSDADLPSITYSGSIGTGCPVIETTTTTAAPTTLPATTTTQAPVTTTTAAPITTTSAPNVSWIAERFDGLVYAYVWLQQGYQINDLVTLNDGSGQCWTLGDQTTANGQYNITGTCPPPTTQPPTTTSTTVATTTTKAPDPTTTSTTSAPTTQPPATTTTQPITTQAPTTTTVAPTTIPTTSTTAAPTTTTAAPTTVPATTTTQAPVTTTTAAPTTTTTTAQIVTYAGSRTSGQSTSDDACNLFAFDNVWFATPTPEDGARVYTDSTASTPFNGGDQWYGIDMDGNGVSFSTRITSFGYMYSTTECLGGGGFP